MTFGGYRSMWVLAMFDLPTESKAERRDYRYFREALLNDGFSMLQYSVYARHCPSEENAIVHEERIKAFLPPDGEVRIITVTDKQFERMRTFYGKTRIEAEKAPEQMK
jgi:CRISPR-associated protein Cas2